MSVPLGLRLGLVVEHQRFEIRGLALREPHGTRESTRGPEIPSISLSIYLTAVLALAGLLTTVLAAPHMLSLKNIDPDSPAVQRAFIGFRRRGLSRFSCGEVAWNRLPS